MISKINTEKLIKVRLEKFQKIREVCDKIADDFYKELDRQNAVQKLEDALISSLERNNAGCIIEIRKMNGGRMKYNFSVVTENGQIVLLPDTLLATSEPLAGYDAILNEKLAEVFSKFLSEALDTKYFDIEKMACDLSWSVSLTQAFFDKVNLNNEEMSDEDTEKWLKEV